MMCLHREDVKFYQVRILPCHSWGQQLSPTLCIGATDHEMASIQSRRLHGEWHTINTREVGAI